MGWEGGDGKKKEKRRGWAKNKNGNAVPQLGAVIQIKRIWPTWLGDCQETPNKRFLFFFPLLFLKARLGLKACFSLFTGPEHPCRL